MLQFIYNNTLRSIMSTQTGTPQQGVFYGILSYVLWGFAPVYFKFLEHVPATEILSHRIVWSVVFIAVIMLILKSWSKLFAVLRQPKKLGLLFISACLIGANWYTYINAINSNHLLSASLGYYITPLVIILMAVIFLRERLSLWKIMAVCLAIIGVLIQIFMAGIFPWVALILATTFSIYSIIRKAINVDSITSLLVETAILLPFAIYFLFGISSQTGALHENGLYFNLLLIAAGIVTTLPLLFYAEAASRLTLSTLGFMQYLAPSIMWLLAVFLYHEPLSTSMLISFGFIWLGLVSYSLDSVFNRKTA